ncbi:MAG: SpaA isopeptide-forming pilin-related protein [Anaerolineaceae bacterium]|jgi:LPXTG-motif cell wall-anchored protein
MQNKKIFTMQRVISIVLVLTMLLSGVSQTGFMFGTKEVQAQQDQPTISTSISTHNGTVEVEEPEQLDPEPGDPEPTATDEPIIIPIETETPVVTPTEKPSETPTEEPIITTPEPSATPDPGLTTKPPVFETPPPTTEPTPKGTDGIFNWEDITIDGVEGVEITAYLGTDTVLNIPATLGDPAKNVISIGAHALQGKQLTFITLPYGLLQIGAYAFADNQLASILTPEPAQHIILPETLRYIQEFAFRDNNLTVLDIPASVYSLGQGAFISNNLNSLTLHEGLQIVGNSVFELNQLVEVWMPNSITSMGMDVFALNGRYVKVVTDNPLIQTEYSPKGFGHVVNPITIIVKHHDPDGNMLISDKVLGADLSIPGEAFSVGVPVTYTPQEISGYMTESPVTFTPDCDGYILTLIYQPTAILPVISKTPIMIPPNASDEEIEVLLQEGLTATDFQGNDITDLVTWTHDIDSSVAGPYTVTYTVTDQWGNTAVKQVEALVGTDWMNYPTCNGWVLGDFKYYNNSSTIISGFSNSGLQKYSNGNRDLCLPGFNPISLNKITEVGYTAFINREFNSVNFSRVTELVKIGNNAFGHASLTELDLSHNTKLETIDYYAFNKALFTSLDFSQNTALTHIGNFAFESSQLTNLNLSQNTALTRIGDAAFRNHVLETIDLSQLSALTYIGSSSFAGLFGSMPAQTNLILPNSCNLLMIGVAAFSNARINDPVLDFSACTQLNYIGNAAFQFSTPTSIVFPNNSPITYIGGEAFANARLTSLDLGSLPNLEFIGQGAFRRTRFAELDFSKTPKLTHIGSSAFQTNENLVNINFSGTSALRYIGGSAFYYAKLTNLDLSDATNLTYIGGYAFRESRLESLNLPALVQYIGDGAFFENKLTHLDLSHLSSLEYIGWSAFSRDSNSTMYLSSISFPDQCALKYIGDHAFRNAQISHLNLSGCKNLSYIGDYAFYTSQLQTLQLDSPALIYVGDWTFTNGKMENLDMTKIPNIVYIGTVAFRYTVASTLDFSQNSKLEYIGHGAFADSTASYVDLSNSPSLKHIGAIAFHFSTLDEIWISPEANFTVRRMYSNGSTGLYTGLYNGDTAVFRTHSGSAVLPPDPNGELVTAGRVTYVYNNKYDYSQWGPHTRSKSTTAWPWSEQYSEPVDQSSGGSNTATGYEYWYRATGGKYIVNPKDITVYSVDEQGNTIADPYTIKTPGGNTYMVYPRPIFGYCTPAPVEVDLTVDNPTVTFEYLDISHCHPGDTTMIHLTQSYNTPIKPGPYLIGEQMISNVHLAMSGYDALIQAPKIVLFYDPSVYDESAIEIPITPGGSVLSYTAENGVLTINLKPISGGIDLEIPIAWRFKKYVTPEYTPFPLDAFFLNDDSHPLAHANLVDFQGYYPDPRITKYANGDPRSGIVLRDFTPSRYGDPAIDDVETEYVDFTFSLEGLERNIGTYTITDVLPVYPSMEDGVESQRTAIFDPTVNPGWVLSADGTTVTYTGNARNSRNTPIPRLRLRFPWAMFYYNIQNSVSGVLTPYNQSVYEDEMHVGDDITFSFGMPLIPPEPGDVFFDKTIYRPRYDGSRAYFYDNDYDRHLDMPWDLVTSTRIDLYDVVLSDFDLDPRLYYASASVPQAFIGGTYHLIDETGISIVTGEITETEISWGQDAGLLTKRVEFHIDHLPAGTYYVVLNTRLVNPDIPHFDETPGSTSNVFWNTGALSGATTPGGDPLYIERDEPLYVRDVQMQVAPRKVQTLSRTPSIPGDPVKYELFVDDRSLGSYHDPLNNFVMIDLMPNGIQVSDVVLSDHFLECEGTYQYVPNYNNTGRVGLVFSAPSLTNPGVQYNKIATIHAVVDPTAMDGDYVNEVFMDFVSDKVTNIGEQVWEQLNDPGNTYSRDSKELKVWSIKEVRAYKAIRLSAAHPWSYTGIETPAGSEFEYALNVFNYTNSPRTNVVLVDVFPYPNDTAITENMDGVRLPRGSEFVNRFDHNRPVTVNLPGYTVQYYNSDTPIVYGTATTEAVLDNLNWTSAPAANTIAIRIVQDAGVELGVDELLQVIVPMKAPENPDLSLSGQYAYNTFVRKDDSTAFGGENRYLEPNRIYNRIPMPTVDIRLTKVGEDPAEYLEGAVFELRDSDGILVKRGITDVNGVINFLDVEIGDYTLTEVQAPTGYKLLPAPIVITQQQMVDAYNAGITLAIGPISNTPKDPDPIRGSVIIEKVNANGDPLANFEFTIEGITPEGPDQPGNTHIRMSGRSGADGRIVFSNLPKGNYRITETRPLVPYHPVDPFYAEIVNQGDVIEFTGNNAIVNDHFALRVNKLGVTADNPCASDPLLCNNQSGSALKDAQFAIYAADGTTLVDGPLTTNEQGYVSFPSAGNPGLLANIRYILREVAGVPGYTPYTQDIPFMFNAQGQLFFCESDASCTSPFDHRQIYVPNIRIPQTGQVTVLKIDNNIPKQGNVIANLLEGAEFTIYKQMESGEWQVVEVLTTDANGLAVSSILPAGVYKIKETKAPLGYYLSPQEEIFVINPYPLPGESTFLEFSYEFPNSRLGMALTKYEMMHLNVTFVEALDLLAAMQGTCPNCRILTTDFRDVPFPAPDDIIVHIIKPLDMANFALLDENKNQLETGVTAVEGWLFFNYEQIDETKTYYLRELVPPAGYRPILGDIPVRIADYTRMPGFDGWIMIPIENKLQLGQISLSKYNRPANEGMAGVEFTLTYPDGVTKSVKLTDANGYIIWPDLAFGTYTLQETATIPGYELDPTVHTVVINTATPHKYIVAYNDQIKRPIEVIKVDRDTQVFIPGAKFALYLIKDDLSSFVMESVTDPVTGNEMFHDVVYGEYWLKETKAPPGYRMNETWQHVVIDENSLPLISFTVEDSPIDENLPDTGTLGALGYLLGGITLMAAGFWFSKRWAKKEL